MNGVQQDVAQMLAMMPTGSVAQYENVLARLEGVPRSWTRRSC
jgi:alkylated DNA nucleotide flippase Atl1